MNHIRFKNVYILSGTWWTSATPPVPVCDTSMLSRCTSRAFISLLPAVGAWRRWQSCPWQRGGWRCGIGVSPHECLRRWGGHRAEGWVSRCTAHVPDSLSAAGRRSGWLLSLLSTADNSVTATVMIIHHLFKAIYNWKSNMDIIQVGFARPCTLIVCRGQRLY